MAVAGNVNTTVINSGSITGTGGHVMRGPRFGPTCSRGKPVRTRPKEMLLQALAGSGSEPRSGRGGRRFKSCHSDHHLAQITTFTGTDCGTARFVGVSVEPVNPLLWSCTGRRRLSRTGALDACQTTAHERRDCCPRKGPRATSRASRIAQMVPTLCRRDGTGPYSC